ncbi:hypothetical protein FNH45_17055 [Salmonella enterica subsp. houtenae]|nr:hypothetical protein [Salmonella enterica subsp. houtenae]HDC2133981.1 hypothetical protein [Salmonella enterica]
MSTPKIVTPIASNKLVDKKSYWSIFYYSIIATITHQKTLTHPWNPNLKSLESYKGQIIEYSFFSNMIGSIKNHGFEYLMAEFLRSEEGWDAFMQLCDSILEDHDITKFPIKYFSISKTGSDYLRHKCQLKHNTRNVEFLLPSKTKNKQGIITLPFDITGKDIYTLMIEDSDLYIEITDGYQRFAFVGEVEGNNGNKMLNKKYFGGLKGLYSTFGISASDRKKFDKCDITDPVTVLWNQNSGQWILNFKKSEDFYCDYITAAENLNKLISGTHKNLMNELRKDTEHLSVIEIIITHWRLDVQILLETLSKSINHLNIHNDIYSIDIQMDNSLIFTPSQLTMPDGVQFYKVKEAV